ncbi:expressed unknown protein [Seminavis robusta]|uniref:Uncharacterized protein n=1 Tax=Seminavis robusta TaxID=568900 RepID=A0A9N8E4S3_9STRA|nr:expressed unknown protein [Seminavis robusta]|eukprot:Sro658_g182730.1 n/a (561) ;mRNA; f:26560-28242
MTTPWLRIAQDYRSYLKEAGFSADEFNNPSFDRTHVFNNFNQYKQRKQQHGDKEKDEEPSASVAALPAGVVSPKERSSARPTVNEEDGYNSESRDRGGLGEPNPDAPGRNRAYKTKEEEVPRFVALAVRAAAGNDRSAASLVSPEKLSGHTASKDPGFNSLRRSLTGNQKGFDALAGSSKLASEEEEKEVTRVVASVRAAAGNDRSAASLVSPEKTLTHPAVREQEFNSLRRTLDIEEESSALAVSSIRAQEDKVARQAAIRAPIRAATGKSATSRSRVFLSDKSASAKVRSREQDGQGIHSVRRNLDEQLTAAAQQEKPKEHGGSGSAVKKRAANSATEKGPPRKTRKESAEEHAVAARDREDGSATRESASDRSSDPGDSQTRRTNENGTGDTDQNAEDTDNNNESWEEYLNGCLELDQDKYLRKRLLKSNTGDKKTSAWCLLKAFFLSKTPTSTKAELIKAAEPFYGAPMQAKNYEGLVNEEYGPWHSIITLEGKSFVQRHPRGGLGGVDTFELTGAGRTVCAKLFVTGKKESTEGGRAKRKQKASSITSFFSPKMN